MLLVPLQRQEAHGARQLFEIFLRLTQTQPIYLRTLVSPFGDHKFNLIPRSQDGLLYVTATIIIASLGVPTLRQVFHTREL